MKKKLIVIAALAAALLLLTVGYFAVLRPILNREVPGETDAYCPVTGTAQPGTLYFVEGTYTSVGTPAEGESSADAYVLDPDARVFRPAPTVADGQTEVYTFTSGGYTLVSPLPEDFALGEGVYFVYGVFAAASGTANGRTAYYARQGGAYACAGIPAAGTALDGSYLFTEGDLPVDSLEQLTAGGIYFLYPQTDRTAMQSISVTNAHGAYRFYRSASDTFVIDGYEGTPFSAAMFAGLVTTVGYPSASKICNYATEAALAEYGLDEPVARWTITTIYGDSYTVDVGDALLAQSGYYYCRLEGRDSVYTVALSKPIISADYSSVTYSEVVLEPVETLVTPALVLGLTTNNYYLTNYFSMTDENEKRLFLINNTVNEQGTSTVDTSAAGTANALSELTFFEPSGYQVNTLLVWNTLYAFADGSLAATECVKLGAGDEDYEALGILPPHRTLSFDVRSADGMSDDGSAAYKTDYRITLFFSELQPDGTYYAVSSLYPQVLAKVSGEAFAFLESPLLDWISPNVFPENIRNIASLQVCTDSRDVTFTLAHDTQISSYLDANGQLQQQYTYLLDVTTDTGLTIPNSEIQNFRQFYYTLLTISIKGNSGLTEEETAAFLRDWAAGETNGSRLLLQFEYQKTDGSKVHLEFFTYTGAGRRVLVFVNDKAEFYVNADDLAEVSTSLEQLLAGIKIDPLRP